MRFNTIASFAIALATGCASDGSPSGHAEESGIVQQELSPNESCDTVSPNQTTNGAPGAFTTGSSYGSSGCYAAYCINANDYGSYSGSSFHYLEYGASVPTSRTECEKLRFGGYAWRLATSGTSTSTSGSPPSNSYLGNRWRWGQWTSNGCVVPYFKPASDLQVGDWVSDYRLAVTARRYSRAKDPSSSFTTQAIRSTWR